MSSVRKKLHKIIQKAQSKKLINLITMKTSIKKTPAKKKKKDTSNNQDKEKILTTHEHSMT